MITKYYLPLSEKNAWEEANHSIFHLLGRHDSTCAPLKKTADDIRGDFHKLYPILDHLCLNTCAFCPDPCCLKAKVWFDLKDLIFLNITQSVLPDSQPILDKNSTCRYLGPRGCLMKREVRPFTCTLYLCPPQMIRLRKNKKMADFFSETISRIKRRRNRLEDLFVSITG